MPGSVWRKESEYFSCTVFYACVLSVFPPTTHLFSVLSLSTAVRLEYNPNKYQRPFVFMCDSY